MARRGLHWRGDVSRVFASHRAARRRPEAEAGALKTILDAGKDFAEVAIQPDPNFIASDEFLTYDVAIFDFRNQNPLPQEEKVEANLIKFVNQPKGLVT